MTMFINRKNQQENLYKYVYDRFWAVYQRGTSTLSSSCRQLALGIGGVSVFGGDGLHSNNHCLILSLLFLLVLFFICDSTQYFLNSNNFKKQAEDFDNKIQNGDITDASEIIAKPGLTDSSKAFFIIKLTILFLASIVFIILSVLRVTNSL